MGKRQFLGALFIALLSLLFNVLIVSQSISSQEITLKDGKTNEPEQIEECEANGATNDNVFDVFGKWMGDISNQSTKFLKEQVFGQQQEATTDEEEPKVPFSHLNKDKKEAESLDNLQSLVQTVVKLVTSSSTDESEENRNDNFEALLQTAHDIAYSGKESRDLPQLWQIFSDSWKESLKMLESNFGHLDFSNFNLLAMFYYFEVTDSIKTPSWKRRQHRYHARLEKDAVLELHNALFLAQLAYANTIDQVKEGLANFLNNSLELIYVQPQGLPGEPAHFMAIQKESEPLDNKLTMPWTKQETYLDIVMAVRGTKEFGDILSDGLLEAVDFRGGKAHAGIAKSGQYLVDMHLETLKKLWQASGRDKVRLWLVGHSLGAGSAAIAAILFNEHEWLEAQAVGFGCPALLDLPQSESTKDFITTVVTDADVIPRMSGASMANLVLDILANDWTSKALEDMDQFLDFLSNKIPFDVPKESIMTWVDERLEKNDRPHFAHVTRERMSQLLFPPGKCIHIYRNGNSFTGTYTPCSFFNQVEFSRTLLDDHMVEPGYHRALLDVMRDALRDLHFDFDHDLVGLGL